MAKNFVRGQEPKKAMDIGISRSRKLLLKKIIFFLKEDAPWNMLDSGGFRLDKAEDFGNTFYAFGDEKQEKLQFTKQELDWLYIEYGKLMKDVYDYATKERDKVIAELEKIKNEQLERI